jgi:hypothetical protein
VVKAQGIAALLKNGIPRLQWALNQYRPGAPEFYFELARLIARPATMGQADSMYEQSLRRGPGQIRTLGNRAQALLSDGKLDAASGVIDRGLAIAPADPVRLSTLGHSLSAWHVFKLRSQL